MVRDHDKLIATLPQKDRGVLKCPTQAEKKWVISKNHIAYYLKKLKEEGVSIETEVNAPPSEE